MDKTKISLIVAPVVVSIICIVLAVNVGVLASQLNAERSKAEAFNSQIIELERQLSDARGRYDEQVRIARDLQYSLDAARREVENAKNEVGVLRSANADLEARLRAASKPAEGEPPTTESPAPATE